MQTENVELLSEKKKDYIDNNSDNKERREILNAKANVGKLLVSDTTRKETQKEQDQ